MADRASAGLSKDTATADPLVGRVIGGRFRITSLVARGGMGKVYRAEQAPLGRICALKVLNPNYAGEHDPEFHKRFFLEASTASKLTHPNTVTIFDYGRTDDDIYYMAMEYLEGHTLHRAIRDAGHLPEARTVHIARQICRSLREAHALGVIHRDLKPANIFLAEHGDEADFVKILDFGLVKLADNKGEDLTQTGMFMGSPKYMSPEQIRGDRVDARADVYALGIVLYEMLTGKVPFDRPNSVNILMAHVGEEAPPLLETNPHIVVSPELEVTVARCMAKDPERRFRSMDDVLAALKRLSVPSSEGASAPASSAARITGLEATERGSISGSGSVHFRAASRSLPQAAPGAGSRWKLVAAVVGASTLAAAAALVVVRPSTRPPPRAAVSEISPRPSSAPSPAPSPAAPAALAMTSASVATAATTQPVPRSSPEPSAVVHVTTDPDGASVKEEGADGCAPTPCDLRYTGTAADADREHRLTVSRPGYRPESRTVKASDSPVNVKLTALPRFPPAPAKAETTPAVPTGYKTDIPY